jgi:hypothetical protein
MKILTYGAIATALVIGTFGSVANAADYRDHRAGAYKSERGHRPDRNRMMRVEKRDHRYNQHRKWDHRPHHAARYPGHGPRAHWKWYKRDRHYGRHAHHHRHGHGPRRIVVTRHHHHGAAAPVIVGSIIGGVIGSEMSGGDRGAAAVGAVMGAVIAADASRNRYDRVTVIRPHRR